MIKRKFSFGLKDLVSKSDTRAQRSTALPSPAEVFFGEASPPPSPLPTRRAPLPPKVEADLKIACAAVVQGIFNSEPPHLNDADDEQRPQLLDYSAIKQSAGAQDDYNFPQPSARRRPVSEVPDFPLPSAPSARKYSYKPDATYKDLFPEGDRPHHTVQANISRRRGELLGLEGPAAGRTVSKATSQSFSVASNLPQAETIGIPRTVRRTHSHDTDKSTPQTDLSEYPWSPSTAPTSIAITPGHPAKHTNSQYQTRGETDKENGIRSEGGRGRHTKQQSISSVNQPAQFLPDKVDSRPPSRARSITRGIKEYIRPGSAGQRSRSISRQGSRAVSRGSARSSASSGVMPEGRQLFSWRGFRQSWQSWKSWQDSEDDADPSRGRSEKRKSGDLRKHKSLNLNRELPPLPGLDQWKGDEPEKPMHIANLWSSKTSKRKSGDLRKSREIKSPILEDERLSKRKSGDLRKSKEVKSPTSEHVVTPSKDEIATARLGMPALPPMPVTSPPLPPTTATVPTTNSPSSRSISPKIARKAIPVPISIAAMKDQSPPPTDSVLDEQENTAGTLAPSNTTDARSASHGGYHTANTSVPSVPAEELTTSVPRAPLQAFSDTQADTSSTENLGEVGHKRRPSRLELDGMAVASNASPHLYQKEIDENTGETSFIPRNMSVNDYDTLKSSKYKYADEISSLSTPPPVPPKDGDKKTKWPRLGKHKKSMTWMDEMEKLGIKDGILLTDDLDGSPIVRY